MPQSSHLPPSFALCLVSLPSTLSISLDSQLQRQIPSSMVSSSRQQHNTQPTVWFDCCLVISCHRSTKSFIVVVHHTPLPISLFYPNVHTTQVGRTSMSATLQLSLLSAAPHPSLSLGLSSDLRSLFRSSPNLKSLTSQNLDS